jgi:hypothetical protein
MKIKFRSRIGIRDLDPCLGIVQIKQSERCMGPRWRQRVLTAALHEFGDTATHTAAANYFNRANIGVNQII